MEDAETALIRVVKTKYETTKPATEMCLGCCGLLIRLSAINEDFVELGVMSGRLEAFHPVLSGIQRDPTEREHVEHMWYLRAFQPRSAMVKLNSACFCSPLMFRRLGEVDQFCVVGYPRRSPHDRQ